MVKRKRRLPPVFLCAISALAVLYAGAFFSPFRPFRYPLATVSALIFISLGAYGLTRRARESGRPRSGEIGRPVSGSLITVSFWISLGILAGAVSWLRMEARRAPLVTLAPKEAVRSVVAALSSDPAPWGAGMYRIESRISSVSTANGSAFSAAGRCTLIVPAPLVRSALPGGLAGKGRAVLFSAGLEIPLSGSFRPWRADTGETFLVDGYGSGTARDTGAGARWMSDAHRIRAALRLSLARFLYDWGDPGALLLALVSGNRDYLSASVSDDFRRSGLSHILAISGMHLSLLSLIALRAGKRTFGKRFSVVLSLAAVLFFVWFAGSSPSLNRALIMAVMSIALSGIGLKAGLPAVLAGAALVQTVALPADALSLAFMLSYAALLGILVFGSAFDRLLDRYVPDFARDSLGSSLGAQLMTSPVCALFLGTIAPVGVLASCIVVPLSTAFIVAGLALLPLSAGIPGAAHWCGKLLALLYECVIRPVRFFASWPAVTLQDLPQTILASIISVTAGILLMLASEAQRARRSPDDSFTRL